MKIYSIKEIVNATNEFLKPETEKKIINKEKNKTKIPPKTEAIIQDVEQSILIKEKNYPNKEKPLLLNDGISNLTDTKIKSFNYKIKIKPEIKNLMIAELYLYLKKKVKLLKSVNNELLMTRSSKIEESDDNIQNESLKNVDKRGYLERYDKCLRIGDEYEAKFINTFPSVVSDFLDEKSGFEIAKKELGFDSLKSVEELKKILGWSSYVKIFLSKIFT